MGIKSTRVSHPGTEEEFERVTRHSIGEALQYAEDIIEQMENRDLNDLTVEDMDRILYGFRKNFNALNSTKRIYDRWYWNRSNEKSHLYGKRMKSYALQAEGRVDELYDQINDIEDELDEALVIVDEVHRQENLRLENPAAMKAWNNYHTVLKLCK